MSSYLWPLAGLALANLLGIISPGPAFLMVSRAAASRSLAIGVALGAGVAVAATIWAAAACFGIALLMTQFASVYGIIQIAGGAYLIWLGISAWRHSRAPMAAAQTSATPASRDGLARAVLTGAWLSLGNPKIIIFFSSIFVALLPHDAPVWVRLVAVAIVGVQEISWYTIVAFVFSRPRVQAAYGRARVWIERALGTVLIGLGARILVAVRL
ncbi:LysE family transporter [Undibacter mobilis]|uniref:LysE family translocator n=1 Tax=Undibacter mobilis TaxID=2292256 RepID=A0A371BBV3_9BRAD|nr:LysE family transporter [Undibacter mobilis]RDV04831.1 LysE family translocator [Undibacter mobilis]